jgi:arylsulfatase A-like enzyme
MPRDFSAPNVVLVVLDTARADAFEPYGAPTGASPVVADMARGGQAVSNVFSAANWTMPAHAALFAGAMPSTIGLARAPDGRATGCKPVLEQQRHRLLPAVLGRAGYETKAVSANLWISADNGFDTGFDTFEHVSTKRNKKMSDLSWRSRVSWSLDAVRARVDDGAEAAAGIIERWLDERQTGPFFWFVNLIECHSPYLPPRQWSPGGPLRRIRAAELAREYQTMLRVWASSAGAIDVPEEAVAEMRAFYAASVRYADNWVGWLLDRLSASGLLDDTIVIVTSDHGENLGESGRMGHAFWLDDRLIRVPLVTLGPVDLPVSAVTSLADVPRLLASALDLQDHPWTAPVADGVAVAATVGLATQGDPRLERLAEHIQVNDHVLWRLTTASTCATDGSLKLVREGDEYWLYDLAVDPLEAAPALLDGRVAAAYGGRLAALRVAVDHAHALQPDAGRSSIPSAASLQVPADLEDQMRLLGYL